MVHSYFKKAVPLRSKYTNTQISRKLTHSSKSQANGRHVDKSLVRAMTSYWSPPPSCAIGTLLHFFNDVLFAVENRELSLKEFPLTDHSSSKSGPKILLPERDNAGNS